MDTKALLTRFEAIPDLLFSAVRDDPVDLSNIQSKLLEKYLKGDKPFKYIIPHDHLFHCKLCGLDASEVRFDCYDPKRSKEPTKFYDSELHKIKQHDGEFTQEQREFLENLLQ